MFQNPDRIETHVGLDSWVKPTGVTLELHVVGTTSVGSMAAVRKSKELLAIREAMSALAVPEDKIRIESVSFAAGERWLSGSSVGIDLQIRDVAVAVAADALTALSAIKGVSLKNIRHEYGDLTAQRDDLLRRVVAESTRQARLIADTAGLSLRAIHQMSQKWVEPDADAMTMGSQMPRSASLDFAAKAAPAAAGYRLLDHHEGRLGLFVRMEFRVNEFDATG